MRIFKALKNEKVSEMITLMAESVSEAVRCKFLAINQLHSNYRDAEKVGIILALGGEDVIKDDN
jgi:hypothetical protein